MSSRNTRNRKLRMCVGKSLTKRGVDTSSAKRRCVAIRAFKLGRGAPGWGCEKTLPDRCCLTQPLSESFVWRNSSSLVAWLLVAWELSGEGRRSFVSWAPATASMLTERTRVPRRFGNIPTPACQVAGGQPGADTALRAFREPVPSCKRNAAQKSK